MSEIKPADYLPVYYDEALEQLFDIHPESVPHVVYGPEISRPGQLIAITVGQLSKITKIKGIKGKGLALLKKAFPSRENMAGKYPLSVSSPKIYLCYAFRLSHLIVCYTHVLFRLFRGDRSVQEAVQQAHRASAVSDWMFSQASMILTCHKKDRDRNIEQDKPDIREARAWLFAKAYPSLKMTIRILMSSRTQPTQTMIHAIFFAMPTRNMNKVNMIKNPRGSMMLSGKTLRGNSG